MAGNSMAYLVVGGGVLAAAGIAYEMHQQAAAGSGGSGGSGSGSGTDGTGGTKTAILGPPPANIVSAMNDAWAAAGRPGGGLNAAQESAWVATMNSVYPMGGAAWSQVWQNVLAFHNQTGNYPPSSVVAAYVTAAYQSFVGGS